MAAESALARLRAFAAEQGLNSVTLAEKLGCHQTSAWRMLGGGLTPSLSLAAAIERLTYGWPGGQIFAVEWARKPGEQKQLEDAPTQRLPRPGAV